MNGGHVWGRGMPPDSGVLGMMFDSRRREREWMCLRWARVVTGEPSRSPDGSQERRTEVRMVWVGARRGFLVVTYRKYHPPGDLTLPAKHRCRSLRRTHTDPPSRSLRPLNHNHDVSSNTPPNPPSLLPSSIPHRLHRLCFLLHPPPPTPTSLQACEEGPSAHQIVQKLSGDTC